jgi:hypothetical protein
VALGAFPSPVPFHLFEVKRTFWAGMARIRPSRFSIAPKVAENGKPRHSAREPRKPPSIAVILAVRSSSGSSFARSTRARVAVFLPDEIPLGLDSRRRWPPGSIGSSSHGSGRKGGVIGTQTAVLLRPDGKEHLFRLDAYRAAAKVG